jgi:hypothetical protein
MEVASIEEMDWRTLPDPSGMQQDAPGHGVKIPTKK